MKSFNYLLAILISTLLAACGGGGGGSAASTYTLSGTVSGPWVEGVKISVSGTATTATTNANGGYSISGLPAGTYTITPSLAGYSYSPSAPSVTISADATQNFTASSAVTTHSVSGNVSYAGALAGGITLRVYNSGCATTGCNMIASTRLASQGGAFNNLPYTIRGLQPGSYVVKGGIGVVNSGYPNASNPVGSAPFTISSTDTTGINVTVTDSTPPSPVTPSLDGVSPGNASALVLYTPPTNANGAEIATSYKLYWGTDANASTGGGSVTFPAQGKDNDVKFLTSLSNGAALYFKMTAIVGANESAASTVIGPVTIGAPTGSNTVSGTVTYTGVTPTGPLMVGVFSNSGVVYQLIPSPAANSQSYSFAGVPNGDYQSFAIVDMNGNGLIDTGDISNTSINTPTITVTGNKTSNITLSTAKSTVLANTDHQFDGSSDNYTIILGVHQGLKRPVAVTIFSGPNIGVPYDIGIDPSQNDNWYWLGSVSPAAGDTYKYRVTYSDGTREDLTATVSAVLGTGNMAQSLAAVTDGTGGSSTTAPLFTWTAPSTPPSSFVYRLHLWGNSDSISWDYPNNGDLPSTSPLQALYSGTTLVSGNSYTWQVQVRDAQGNSATRAATYLP